MSLKADDISWVLVDLDDTLIECVNHYWTKRDEAYKLMAEAGIDTTDAQKVMDAIEHDNVRRFGFAKERFPISLAATYEELCRLQDTKMDHYVRHCVEGAGWSVYEVAPKILPGAREFLTMLRKLGVTTILFTKGDPEVQMRKVSLNGFSRYFDHIEIVRDKTVETFREVMIKHNIHREPHRAVMLGDSIKGDINPAIACGMHAIYIPCENAWGYEKAELDPFHIPAKNLTEAGRILRGVA